MHLSSRQASACALACLFVGGSTFAALPAEYTFLDLGTLGGVKSEAYAINASGQVVGFAKDAAGNNWAFRTAPNSPISSNSSNLGSLAAGYASFAYAINSAGQVVGQSGSSAGDRAFRYSAATMANLGTLGGNWSYAYGINASGQVTGGAATANKPSSPTHAFLYSGSQMYDLGTLGIQSGNIAQASYGQSINSNGVVTGYSTTTADSTGYAPNHAFLWTPSINNGITGTLSDLGTLGGTESYAYAINDAGQVVGGANTTSDAAYHAFLRTTGPSPVMLDLGTLGGSSSESDALNAKGHIVGWSNTAAGTSSGFIYTGRAMRDLNAITSGATGWTISHAQAVNDSGQIAGYGVAPDGQTRGYLLSPIPTWATDADANWSASANWSTPAAPNASGATANLTAAITAPRTITLDTPVTLGQLNFASTSAYTLAGSSALTLSGASGLIRSYQGTHTIAVPLNLVSGASIVLDPAAGLKLSGPIMGTLASLSLGAGSTIDLTNRTLSIAQNPTALANIVSWLSSAYNGGAWSGPGITSSAAAADPQKVTALGYSANGTVIKIASALFGDANLDGKVNADDYALLDRGLAEHLTGWSNGDFNYDGVIDSSDYLLIDRSYILSGGTPSPQFLSAREAEFGPAYVGQLMASVPEPSLAPILIAPIAICRGRRRSLGRAIHS